MVDSNSTIAKLGDDQLQDDDTKSQLSQTSDLWETSGVGVSALCLNLLQDISDAASQYSGGDRTMSRQKKEPQKKRFADFFKIKRKSKSKKPSADSTSDGGTLDRKKSQNGQSAFIQPTDDGNNQKEKEAKYTGKEEELKRNSSFGERNFDVSSNKSATLPRNKIEDDTSRRQKGKTLSAADAATKGKKIPKAKRNTPATVEQNEGKGNRLTGSLKRLESSFQKMITNANRKFPTTDDLTVERNKKEDDMEIPTDKIESKASSKNDSKLLNRDEDDSKNKEHDLEKVDKNIIEPEERTSSDKKNATATVLSRESPKTVPRGRPRERDSDGNLRRGRSAETLPTKGQTRRIRRRALSREWVVVKTTTTEYTTTFNMGSKNGDRQSVPSEEMVMIPQPGSKTELTSPETARENGKMSVPEKNQAAVKNPLPRRSLDNLMSNDMNNNDFSEYLFDGVRKDLGPEAPQPESQFVSQQGKKLTDGSLLPAAPYDSFHNASANEEKSSNSPPYQAQSFSSIPNAHAEGLMDQHLPREASFSVGDGNSAIESNSLDHPETHKACNPNPFSMATEALSATDPRLTATEFNSHQTVSDEESSVAIDARNGLEKLARRGNVDADPITARHGWADEDEKEANPKELKFFGNDEPTPSGPNNKLRWTKRKSTVRNRIEKPSPEDKDSAESYMTLDPSGSPRSLNDRDWPEDTMHPKIMKNGNSSPRMNKPRWTKRKATARGNRQPTGQIPEVNYNPDTAQQFYDNDSHYSLANGGLCSSGALVAEAENVDMLAANSATNKPRWTKRQTANRGSRALVGVNSPMIRANNEPNSAPSPTMSRTQRSPKLRGTHRKDDGSRLDSGYSTLNRESSRVSRDDNTLTQTDEHPVIAESSAIKVNGDRHVPISKGILILEKPDLVESTINRNNPLQCEDKGNGFDESLPSFIVISKDKYSSVDSSDIYRRSDDVSDKWSKRSPTALKKVSQPLIEKSSAVISDGSSDALVSKTPTDDESPEPDVYFDGISRDQVDFDVTPTNNETLLYWNNESDSDTISDRNETRSQDDAFIENDESSYCDESPDGNDAAYFADIDTNEGSAYRGLTDTSAIIHATNEPTYLSSTDTESAYDDATTGVKSQFHDRDWSMRFGSEFLENKSPLNTVLDNDSPVPLCEIYERKEEANIDADSLLSSTDLEGNNDNIQETTRDRKNPNGVQTSPSSRHTTKVFEMMSDNGNTEEPKQYQDQLTPLAENLLPCHEEKNSDTQAFKSIGGRTAMEMSSSGATNLNEVYTELRNTKEEESSSSIFGGSEETYAGHRRTKKLEENLTSSSAEANCREKEITGADESTASRTDPISEMVSLPNDEESILTEHKSQLTEHESLMADIRQKAKRRTNSKEAAAERDGTLSPYVQRDPAGDHLQRDSKSVDDRPIPSLRGTTNRRFMLDEDRFSPMFLSRRLHVDVPYSDSGYSETEVETLSPCSFRSSISRADTVTEEGRYESLTDDDSRFGFSLTEENIDDKKFFMNIPGFDLKSNAWEKESIENVPKVSNLHFGDRMTWSGDTLESASDATADEAVFDAVSPAMKKENVLTVLPRLNELETSSQMDEDKYSLESFLSHDSGIGSSVVKSEIFQFPEKDTIDDKPSDLIALRAVTQERQTQLHRSEEISGKQIQEYIKDLVAECGERLANEALNGKEETKSPEIDILNELQTGNSVISVSRKSPNLCESVVKEKESDIFNGLDEHEIAFRKIHFEINHGQTVNIATKESVSSENLSDDGSSVKEKDIEIFNSVYQQENALKDSGFTFNQVQATSSVTEVSANYKNSPGDVSPVKEKERDIFNSIDQQEKAVKDASYPFSKVQARSNVTEVSANYKNSLEDPSAVKKSEIFNRLNQQEDIFRKIDFALNQSPTIGSVTEVTGKSENILKDGSAVDGYVKEKESEILSKFYQSEGAFVKVDSSLNCDDMKIAFELNNRGKEENQLKFEEVRSMKSDNASRSELPGISVAMLKKEMLAELEREVVPDATFTNNNIMPVSVIYPSVTEKNTTVECQVAVKEKNLTKAIADVPLNAASEAKQLENDLEVLTWHEYAELFSIYRQFPDGNITEESLRPSAWIWNCSQYAVNYRAKTNRDKIVHFPEPRPCRSFSFSAPPTTFALVGDRNIRPRHKSTSALERQTQEVVCRPGETENATHKEHTLPVSKSDEINDTATKSVARKPIEDQNNSAGKGFSSATSTRSANKKSSKRQRFGGNAVNKQKKFEEKIARRDNSKAVAESVDSNCTESQNIAGKTFEHENTSVLNAECAESVDSSAGRNYSTCQLDVRVEDQVDKECLEGIVSTLDSPDSSSLTAEDLSRPKNGRQNIETENEQSQSEPLPFANENASAVSSESGDLPDNHLRQRSRPHPEAQDETTPDDVGICKSTSDDNNSAPLPSNRSKSSLVGFLASTAGLLSIIFLIYISVRNSGNLDVNSKNQS